MFALGIRYLTGYAAATHVADRERAEWPPHPARVFMALAAAHFETGEDAAERGALEWLEALGPPGIHAPNAAPRDAVKFFVPVNDKAGPAKMTLQTAPRITREKKERFFPCVRIGEGAVFLLWSGANLSPEHRAAMESLCAKVIRIGHSSSLVQMWVEDNPPAPNWEPDEFGGLRARVTTSGTLRYLRDLFNADAFRREAELTRRITAAKEEKRTIKGEGARERKAALHAQIEQWQTELKSLDLHPPLRPTISLWQGYRRVAAADDAAAPASGLFDPNLLVLTLQDGPTVSLETTWRLMTAMRDTILSRCDEPVPEWISGHQPDGRPSEHPHLALIPLAFVGREHADGHIMGLALAFPETVPPRERGRALRRLLYDDAGQPAPIRLRLGALGAWTLVRETRESPPLTLQPDTWTRPSRTWATVTPIVLDRHPKADYRKERVRWQREVAESIADSCVRQGLPAPELIDVDKTCWHRGAPRAIPGKSGFPLAEVKPGRSHRQQVHAWLQFDQDVQGPLLLGAGRYRGYGLCKPWKGGYR